MDVQVWQVRCTNGRDPLCIQLAADDRSPNTVGQFGALRRHADGKKTWERLVPLSMALGWEQNVDHDCIPILDLYPADTGMHTHR
ncbi:MAG: hypothetical protein ACKVZ6_03025 [Kineosporiaceae bacterium]